jgi:RHS repeat-associated protein
MSGPLASANAYRFSSKEWNANSGLYYYLYRFYDPKPQRWLNRDPIEEDGGINLYAYLENNTINRLDALGLQSAAEVGANTGYGWGLTGNNPTPEIPEAPGENIPGSGDYIVQQLEMAIEQAAAPFNGTPEGYCYGSPQPYDVYNPPVPPVRPDPPIPPPVTYPPLLPDQINSAPITLNWSLSPIPKQWASIF